jgi:hypothetical protein
MGTVPDFNGPEFLLPADNGDDLRTWIQTNGIETSFTTVNGHPAGKIRGKLAAKCHPGLRIRHTIAIYDRRDGRRIRGVVVDPL